MNVAPKYNMLGPSLIGFYFWLHRFKPQPPDSKYGVEDCQNFLLNLMLGLL